MGRTGIAEAGGLGALGLLGSRALGFGVWGLGLRALGL